MYVISFAGKFKWSSNDNITYLFLGQNLQRFKDSDMFMIFRAKLNMPQERSSFYLKKKDSKKQANLSIGIGVNKP